MKHFFIKQIYQLFEGIMLEGKFCTAFWIRKVTWFLFCLLLCVLKNRIIIMIQFAHLTDKWDTKCPNTYMYTDIHQYVTNPFYPRRDCETTTNRERDVNKKYASTKKIWFSWICLSRLYEEHFSVYSSIFNQQSVFRFKCKLSQTFSSVPSIH